MKNDILETEEQRLSELLRRSRLDPLLPPRFQEGVWRRLDAGATAGRFGSPLAWLDLLVEGLLRPRVALAGMASVMLIAALVGAMSGVAGAREAAQARYVAAVSPHP